MPQYVILEHDHPVLHWDFMLEWGGALRTWRLAEPPTTPGIPIAATPLADHRVLYLDYEGPVSGNRGWVKRWAAGEYDVLEDTESTLVVRLRGGKIAGQMKLDVAAATWTLFLSQ